MSTKYKHGEEVPIKLIVNRLHELSDTNTELDLVMREAASRLAKMFLLFKEINDYLNINEQTSIAHGSILHKQVQEFLNA